MADPQRPILLKPVPPIATYEGAAFGPIDLKQFVKSPTEEDGFIKFYGEIAETGEALPQGLICTVEGLVGGIPAKGTAGTYLLAIVAENRSLEPLIFNVKITVGERLAVDDPMFLTDFKSQVWKALGADLPLPEMADLLNLPITPVEIYYLLQRFAVLTIWDVYNLEPASTKNLIMLPGASEHYNIYDRGSCLVGGPKDLFSHERTLADALQTAKVMAREVYKRGWTIEFAGFNKMVRAAWIELQNLSDKHGKQLEILHYTPSPDDLKVYVAQAQAKGPTI